MKDQKACAPGSNFNFKELYYCQFEKWFCYNAKAYFYVPLAVSLFYR